MIANSVTTDFQCRPYWWEAAAPVAAEVAGLAPRYDVVVIGSGFTGISAALTLARAGREVLVLDREDPGAGASRRNAGFIGRVLKKSYSDLIASKGSDAAKAIYRDLHTAYEAVLALTAAEDIQCYAQRPGRFIGATSPAHYRALEADLARVQADLGHAFAMVPAAERQAGSGSPLYHGGAVIPDSGSLHPGLYHKGLLDRAVAAGTQIQGKTEVLGFTGSKAEGFVVQTSRGTILASELVVGTNGYTTKLPWYQRRLVPFRAYMAATEELAEDLLERLVPEGRTIIDSNTNIDFFRRAPDSPRLLFGGATAENLVGPEAIALRMKSILDRVFPEARSVRLSHVWDGYCAGTFDFMPHCGERDGVHYGMGYNFAGITLGTTFGRRIGERILGVEAKATKFEGPHFPTIPLYTGNPWFMPIVMRYFDWQDSRPARRS